MRIKQTNLIKLVVLFFIFSIKLEAKNVPTSTSHESNDSFDVVNMIMHHITDAHEWHFWGNREHSVTLPLPIILLTDNGLVTFMSSEFKHKTDASVTVSKNGLKFVNFHEKIYQLESHTHKVEFIDDGHSIKGASLPLDFSITKNVLTVFLAAIICFLLFIPLARFYKRNKTAPKGLKNALETFIVFVKDEVAIPNIGKSKYKKYMPYLLSVFFLIWIGNMLGLLPGAANLTGNISFTLTLAVFTLLFILLTANKAYWKHIFWMPGVPVPMKLFLLPIELIGVFTKPFALMIRLFANITAGHIVVLSLIAFIFIFKSVAVAGFSVPFALFIYVIELLVAFIQAFIFTMLSALFIGMAVSDHDDH